MQTQQQQIQQGQLAQEHKTETVEDTHTDEDGECSPTSQSSDHGKIVRSESESTDALNDTVHDTALSGIADNESRVSTQSAEDSAHLLGALTQRPSRVSLLAISFLTAALAAICVFLRWRRKPKRSLETRQAFEKEDLLTFSVCAQDDAPSETQVKPSTVRLGDWSLQLPALHRNVYQCLHLHTGLVAVVKLVHFNKVGYMSFNERQNGSNDDVPIDECMALRDFRCEVEFLQSKAAQHRHIVQMLCHHESIDGGAIWLKVASFNSLHHLSSRWGPLHQKLDLLRHVATQVTSALSHIHSHGWTHCDVKLGNTLLSESFDVLLSDFGHCVRTRDLPGYALHPVERDQCGRPVLYTRTSFGTWFARAPEVVLLSHHYHSCTNNKAVVDIADIHLSDRIDVWALGILVHQLASRNQSLPHFLDKVVRSYSVMQCHNDSLVSVPMSTIHETSQERVLSRGDVDRVTQTLLSLALGTLRTQHYLSTESYDSSRHSDESCTCLDTTATVESLAETLHPPSPVSDINDNDNVHGSVDLHARDLRRLRDFLRRCFVV
ncbi:MAG: hypothetical protein MHM6MM_002691 [Cercozoa sp. M6MM]